MRDFGILTMISMMRTPRKKPRSRSFFFSGGLLRVGPAPIFGRVRWRPYSGRLPIGSGKAEELRQQALAIARERESAREPRETSA